MDHLKKIDRKEFTQVSCPYCGYRMPVFFTKEAECKGLRISCKGRNCKRDFEILIKDGQEIK